MSIAVQGCVRQLRRGPVACRGIEIGIDRAWLNIVHRDASASYFAGQSLGKHLDGALCRAVGGESRSHVALPNTRADRDNATTVWHVLQRSLSRHQHTTEVDVDHEVHLF